MSTRYVWGKYSIKYPSPTYSTVLDVSHTSAHGSTHTHLDPIATDSYTQSISGDNVVYSVASGAASEDVGLSPCSKYPYVVFKNSSFRHLIAHMTNGRWFTDNTSGTSHSTYRLKWTSNEDPNIVLPTGSNFKVGSAQKSDCSAGASIGSISNKSYNYWPNDGVYFDIWYKYKGSDSIDPDLVSVSDKISPNASVTVRITPSSSNLYGGTITYTLSYSLNGSGWAEIGTSTATSVSFTIPPYTIQSIQFRVLAQDDMGFTSTTYVYSQTYYADKYTISASASPAEGGAVSGAGSFYEGTSVTLTAAPNDGWEFVSWKEGSAVVSTSASYTFTVSGSRTLTAVFKQKLALWVGVGGKARKGVELYIGVNGKARKVVGAWVGVDGKARRFL